jgi:hypothetical protein
MRTKERAKEKKKKKKEPIIALQTKTQSDSIEWYANNNNI